MFIIVWLSKEGVSGRGHGVDGLRDFNQRSMFLLWIRSINGIAAEKHRRGINLQVLLALCGQYGP